MQFENLKKHLMNNSLDKPKQMLTKNKIFFDISLVSSDRHTYRVGSCLTDIPRAAPSGLTDRIAWLNCDFFIKTIIYHQIKMLYHEANISSCFRVVYFQQSPFKSGLSVTFLHKPWSAAILHKNVNNFVSFIQS